MNRRAATWWGGFPADQDSAVAKPRFRTASLAILLASIFLGCASARAASSSANYTILHDTLDSAGGHVQSVSYSIDTSLASFGGVSFAAARAVEARVGFAGQLNAPPQAAIAALSVVQGVTGTLTLSGADADRDPITLRVASTPAHGVLSGTLPNLTYRHDGSLSATDQFLFVVNDGTEDSVPGIVRISISLNFPPVLDPIPDQVIDEGQLLSVPVRATDPDLPPQQLLFDLAGGAPDGAQAHPFAGAFQWIPTEAQGPGVYQIVLRVTDNGNPRQGAFQRFTVTVREVNQAPVVAPVTPLSVMPGTELNVTVQASDPDLPAQPLRFSLGPTAPASVQINPDTGVLRWTPGTVEEGKLFAFDVTATDNGVPPLGASQLIQVQVLAPKTNTPPMLSPLSNQVVAEGTALVFSVSAIDAETPPENLVYSLEPGAPARAIFDPTTRSFTWTPAEAHGPGSFPVTIRVTDQGNPPLSDVKSFTISVTEVNLPPTLSPILDQSVRIGESLTVSATATDPDQPAQTLAFNLTAAPSGATIDLATGRFVWTPDLNQPPGQVTVTLTVRDDATPSESASVTFRVNVLPPFGWALPILISPDQIQLVFNGAPGACYRLEATSDFIAWTEEETGRADVLGRFSVVDRIDPQIPVKVYRVVNIACDFIPQAALPWNRSAHW